MQASVPLKIGKQTKNYNESLSVLGTIKRHKLNFLYHSVFLISNLGSKQLEEIVTKMKFIIFITHLIENTEF